MAAKVKRSARTRGCELNEVDVDAILTEHVPMAKCTADKLFKFKPKLKWDSCAEWRSILSAILDSSGGRIPLQKTWHLQVRRWLAKQGKVWAWMDSENAAYGLRHMLQTMLKRKQCHGRPPHRFEHLSSVLEKMHIEISENEGEPEASEEDEECLLCPVVAAPVSCYEVSSASSDGEGQVPLEVVSAESLDRLEKMLYPTTPPKPKRIRAKSPTPFSTPPKMPPLSCPSFAGIDDVVAMSLRMVHEKPPLPSSYRDMSAARKKLKTKGKKKGKGTGKKICKRPAAHSADELDTHGIAVEDIVASYFDKRGGDVDDHVLQHRLRSRLWHLGRDRESKEFAGKVGRFGVEMWQGRIASYDLEVVE